MEVIGNFNQLTYWNLENKPSSNDAFHKAFDWLDMAHVVSCCHMSCEIIEILFDGITTKSPLFTPALLVKGG